MKIKVKKSPIYIILATIFLFEMSLIDSLGIPYISKTNILPFVNLLLVLFLLVNCISNKNIMNKISTQLTYFWVFVLIFVAFVIAQIIFSLNKYNENMYDMAVCVRPYLYLFLFVPIIYIFNSEDDYQSLFKYITALTLFYVLVFIVVALFNNFFDIKLLKNFSYAERYGRTRIGLNSTFGLAFIFSMYSFLNLKKTDFKKYIFMTISGIFIFYMFYINMTRMYIVALMISFVVLVLFKDRPKGNQFIVWSLMLLAIFFLSKSTAFNNFLSSFSSTATDTTFANSTIVRESAKEYFRNIVSESPVFGMGFVSPRNFELTKIFYGPNLNACFDDLGIINMWYHYGILGIIFTGVIFVRMIHIIFRLLISKQFKEKQLVFGLIAYQISLMPSLSVFDGQRIIMVPILWALLEFFNAKNKDEVAEITKKIREHRKLKIKLTNFGKPMNDYER